MLGGEPVKAYVTGACLSRPASLKKDFGLFQDFKSAHSLSFLPIPYCYDAISRGDVTVNAEIASFFPL